MVTPLYPCRPGVTLLQGTDIPSTAELEGDGGAQGKTSLWGSLQSSCLYLHKKINTFEFLGESGFFGPPWEEAGLPWKCGWMHLLRLSITAPKELHGLRLEQQHVLKWGSIPTA